MSSQQERSDTLSTLLSGVGMNPVREDMPSRFNTFLASFRSRGHRRLHQVLPPLPLPPFQEEPSPKWGGEVRGLGEPKEFVVVILAHYRGWTMTVRGKERNLQLNAVLNDPQVLLKCLGYRHGDTSRRWYFVMDFDVDFKDADGLVKRLPRAKLPGTETVVLPTSEGILGLLRAASREGKSGFVHCGMHCMYAQTGTSSITLQENGTVRYTETPNGSPTNEAFIVGTDGVRLYGRDFLGSLSDGDPKRRGTTLTLMFDMCNATEFLAGVVGLPYQIGSPTTGGATSSFSAPRSANQLVVISASQRDQPAGEYRQCGALTFLLSTALTIVSEGKCRSAEGPDS
ncbi:hypothetical protein FRC01_002820 [Tulasnella sp. 417]|nr:hypothetical protein FRC01_002820 [Tulasnella sp. 417]